MPTSMERSFAVVALYGIKNIAGGSAWAPLSQLSQRQVAVSLRYDRLAALAELGVTAAVAHDPADLLALDIAVDPGHPRVDLGEQQTLARRNDVVGPGGGTRRSGLDAGQIAVAREADEPRHPIGAVFGGTRKVAKPGMRAHHHQHVREAVHQDAEKGLRPVLPLLLQRHPVHAADVDAIEGAGDRVETGRVNDDVELVFAITGFDARRGDALDRRLVDVDQLDVGLVVDLEIAAFERHAAGAEAMIIRDQPFGDDWILDALTGLACDEIRDQRIGLAVHQDVAEIAHPDAEARLAVEFLPKGLTLLGGHLEGGTRVGRMDEAAVGLLATREDLGIIGPDPAHLLVRDLGVVQWRAPLRRALEYRQMAGRLGHLGDRLDAGGTRADHRDALPLECHSFFGPVMGVAGLALECLDTGDARHCRGR